MTAIISTAYSRDLGDELRRLRESCTSFGGRAMAAQLGWDPSKVSNIETGKARASEIDLAQYLATCGKDIDFLDEFRGQYRNAFESYIVQVPDNLRTIAMTEAMATKITSFDIMTVHGLIQTERYAHELFVETALEAPHLVEKFVRFRMERQAIMRRPESPECLFFVHELALQTQVGGAQVMEDQYLQLLFNAHRLRIVPAKFRALAVQSKCTLYEFEKLPPIAYTETDLAKVFVQDSAAITWSRKLFDRLDAVALNEEQSKGMLAEYVSGLREDPHDRRTDLA